MICRKGWIVEGGQGKMEKEEEGLLTQPTFSHFWPKHLYNLISVLHKTCLVYWSFDPLVCSFVRLMLNYMLIDLLFTGKTCVFQHSFIFHSILFFLHFLASSLTRFSVAFYSLWLSTAATGNQNSYPNKSYLCFFQQYGEIHAAQFTYCFSFLQIY